MANEGNISLFSQASRYGIIYSDLGFKLLDKNTGEGESAKALFDNEVMNKTDVARNNKIVYLNSAVWYTMTAGIESTNIMIDEISAAIK